MFCKKLNTYNMALACYPLALRFSFTKQNKYESNKIRKLNSSNFGMDNFVLAH